MHQARHSRKCLYTNNFFHVSSFIEERLAGRGRRQRGCLRVEECGWQRSSRERQFDVAERRKRMGVKRNGFSDLLGFGGMLEKVSGTVLGHACIVTSPVWTNCTDAASYWHGLDKIKLLKDTVTYLCC